MGGRVWEHTKAERRLMARAFLPALGLTMLAFGLLYLLVVVLGEAPPEADPSQPSKWAMAPVALVYGMVIGFWPGVVVGLARLSFRLVGAWTLVPLTLIPAATALALWLASGLFASLGAEVLDAARIAAAEHDYLVLAIGKAAHAGPVVLVIALPLLLIDLGAIALQPSVLGPLVTLIFAFVFVVAAAVIPTTLVSMLVLLKAYISGLRERIAEREGSPRPAEPAQSEA